MSKSSAAATRGQSFQQLWCRYLRRSPLKPKASEGAVGCEPHQPVMLGLYALDAALIWEDETRIASDLIGGGHRPADHLHDGILAISGRLELLQHGLVSRLRSRVMLSCAEACSISLQSVRDRRAAELTAVSHLPSCP